MAIQLTTADIFIPNIPVIHLFSLPQSTPMSSSVLMLESPKREPSQTPPVAFTPGMNGFHLPSSIAKTVAVPEEREALTPSLVSEAPSTKSSFTAGSGLHTVTGTPMLFPSLSLTGGLKKPKRTRRKRCLKCEGCRRKDNCGVCSVCTNPSAINPVCKKRRCELLKIRPSAVPVSQLLASSSLRIAIDVHTKLLGQENKFLVSQAHPHLFLANASFFNLFMRHTYVT